VRARDDARGTLITAFDPFGGLTANPSATLVAELATQLPAVHSAVLPTSYRGSWIKMDGLLRRQRPSAVIMFGYAKSVVGLRLEECATNRDTARQPDNDGEIARGLIVADAPDVLRTTVCVEQLAMMSSEICPISVSRDAGGYVCNRLYFLTLYAAAGAATSRSCLFIHVGDWEGCERAAAIVSGAVAVISRISELLGGAVRRPA
jgi:pyroglutamyl-peptidase